MFEGHLLELQADLRSVGARSALAQLLPLQAARPGSRHGLARGLAAKQMRDAHRVAHARQLREDLADGGAAIEVLAAVPVAVDRQQHLRLELREAVDDAARAELRRRARPDRAEA